MFSFIFPMITQHTIGADTRINGDVRLKGTVKIAGHIDGSLTVGAEDKILIGKNGMLRCDTVNAKTIIVEGSLYAKHIKVQCLIIRNGGEVHGAIEAQSFTVQPNARYNGHVALSAPPPIAEKSTPAKIAKERLESVTRT